MYYHWDQGETNDPLWKPNERVEIKDAITGEEIRVVFWCDTELGMMERAVLDENGEPQIDEAGEDVKKVKEKRAFTIVFPDREAA